MKFGRWFALVLTLVAGSAPAATYVPSSQLPPAPAREFRAAWVATVANIDWPSKPGLTVVEQKAELIAMLDRAARLNLNTVIFQVRPACDALYPSALEPWSEYLTGSMGQPPRPYYDPLRFALEEAHRRGLELHAWFNPFRARHFSGTSPLATNHVARTRPQWVKQYGKYLWLDPGEPAVQEHCLQVVLDVVRRYDIDGIHFDDYFYPYKEHTATGAEVDFPDEPSWRRYGVKSHLSREDWRRENINGFVQRAYQSIKTAKPWVKFGISPFGIWRPGNPAQIDGLDAYSKLYADSRKWLAEGWVDYLAPQLYWAIQPPEQSFPVLLKWWAGQNRHNRLLVAGLDSARTAHQWKPEEILAQIRLTRRQQGAGGQVHWDMKSLMGEGGLSVALVHGVYAEPALVPAAPWLGGAHCAAPNLVASPGPEPGSWRFGWRLEGGGPPAHWVLQTREGEHWRAEILPASLTERVWRGTEPDAVALTAVDRNGNLGPATVLEKAGATRSRRPRRRASTG